ncbi:5-oxoprolinase subunit PxpA [Litorimonas haliclonae]|uniref:5-oxoprolinase subunit PxpA n=1 Tax=Litorimonas haliclonae TaxID=2081977 RepID=UPI0039EFB614
MKFIDLNADVGEADTPEWADAEAEILRYVTSANVACGGHAGDDQSMRKTVRAAKANGVVIGAHPAYPDKENFGRQSLKLGTDISSEDLEAALKQQILRLREIAREEGVSVSYVKPHGALYNDSVQDARKADLIAKVISKIDSGLTLLGGPNSEMKRAAENYNLGFVAEGFIDRRYTNEGHLLSRFKEGAVLETDEARIEQALGLAIEQKVFTDSGDSLAIHAGSLCLHGDSQGAIHTAQKARAALEQAGIKIQAFISQTGA